MIILRDPQMAGDLSAWANKRLDAPLESSLRSSGGDLMSGPEPCDRHRMFACPFRTCRKEYEARLLAEPSDTRTAPVDDGKTAQERGYERRQRVKERLSKLNPAQTSMLYFAFATVPPDPSRQDRYGNPLPRLLKYRLTLDGRGNFAVSDCRGAVLACSAAQELFRRKKGIDLTEPARSMRDEVERSGVFMGFLEGLRDQAAIADLLRETEKELQAALEAYGMPLRIRKLRTSGKMVNLSELARALRIDDHTVRAQAIAHKVPVPTRGRGRPVMLRRSDLKTHWIEALLAIGG